MRLAVLTSGGDAPGMNAAVRSIVLAGQYRGHEVIGIRDGYEGLLAGTVTEFPAGATDGITAIGGTILGSSRSSRFPTPEGQELARQRLRELGVEVLVVIGGNGSLAGAHALAQARTCRVLGIGASIDNDIGLTGLAIGVDTAVNTIVEACDRISDTARAHRRAFIVEVMGRRCGFLAMRAGIAAEADAVLHGEQHVDEEQLVERLRAVLRRGFAPGRHKRRVLIVKAEGVAIPTARLVERLCAHIPEDAPGVEIRETILGHVVRGGCPSALDRSLAQRLGFAAVVAAEAGKSDMLLGWDVPHDAGEATPDPAVRAVPIADVLAETARLLDGTSAVARMRLALLGQVEDMLAV